MPMTEAEIQAKEQELAEREKALADKKDAKDDASSAQIVQAIRNLSGHIQRINQDLADLRQKGGGPTSKPEPKNPDTTPLNLERMSRAEFANYLVNQVQEKLVKPQVERFEGQQQQTTQAEMKTQLEKIQSNDEKLFGKLYDSFKEVLQTHTTLDVNQAWGLTKAMNQELVQAHEKEIADAKQAQEFEEEKQKLEKELEHVDPEVKHFGGILPTSGMYGSTDGMDAREAAEKAFDDLVVPGGIGVN